MKTFKRKLVDNSMDLFIEVDGQYVANDNLFKRVIPAMVKPEVLQVSQREQEQNIQTNTQNKDEKGDWHSTSGMEPNPYMRPALN